MTRASDTALDVLHGLLAGALKDELARAMARAALPATIDSEDGPIRNPEYAPINPQLIDKVLKFLKDNGVDAPAKSERVDSLSRTLSDLDLDDVGHDMGMPN